MAVEPDANNARNAANIGWEVGAVTRADRANKLQMRGATFWFTGLSGAGKSTIAVEVERRLIAEGTAAYRVDGDNLRHGLCRDLGFSPADRAQNVARAGEVACLLADAGLVVLASLVSPFRADRDRLRALHASRGIPFVEVHVAVPLKVAEQRDTKGLYRRARAGELQDFTGVQQPYEEPIAPELLLETATTSLEQCVEQVLARVRAL
ncbi:MAG: adenylyl-sulfate kinase [Phycisphaerales bacterium]|nr:adenylyl-sulfate kinase [Phycisphaerales bacterium]